MLLTIDRINRAQLKDEANIELNAEQMQLVSRDDGRQNKRYQQAKHLESYTPGSLYHA
jgi:hypothetical protein